MGNHNSNEGKKPNLGGQKHPINRKMRRGSKPYDDVPAKKSRSDSYNRQKPTLLRKEVVDEIRDGLQLWIRFQESEATLVELSLRELKSIYSFSKQVEENNCSGVLLFTDIESLEAAKISLEKNTLIDEVDYMGVRSKTARITCGHTNPKLLFEFNYIADEKTVKKIREDILSAKLISQDQFSKQSCFLVEFPVSAENSIQSLIEHFQEYIGYNGLREVREYVPLTEQQKVLNKRHLKLIVLRDVPKSATVHHIATLFPFVTGIRVFRRTFPASNYCHAILLFSDARAAFAALKKARNAKVEGKRLFAFPFHHSLMRDSPDLGEETIK